MSDSYQRLIREVSALKNMVSRMVHVGTVADVRPDQIRMVIGKDHNGKDVIGPWIPTGNTMYGGARQRRFFKKGQNLAILMVNGDPRQGIILPYSPNKNFLAPDHANNTGQDEETYQLDHLRRTEKARTYELWLADPDQATEEEEPVPQWAEKQTNPQLLKKKKVKDSEKSVVLFRFGEKEQEEQQQQQQQQGGQQQQQQEKKPKGKVLLRAKEEIIFQVGNSKVTIHPDEVLVESTTVTNKGTKNVVSKVAKSVIEVMEKQIDVFADDVSIAKMTWIGQEEKGKKEGIKFILEDFTLTKYAKGKSES